MSEPLFSPLPAGAVYEPVAEVETEPIVSGTEEIVIPPIEIPTEPPAAIAEPVTETAPLTAIEVKETIREVEKIVEKYPAMDEYTGQIFQALLDGKETELLSYLSEKHKDYKTMSDYDAVKFNILKSNPNYTDEIAELKMERLYGEVSKINLSKINKEDSPEEYAEAEEHNAKVAENLKLLKLDAFDARLALEAGKKDIKLPKINESQVQAQPQPTVEEIAQARSTWEGLVTSEVPKVKEFAWKVGDEDVAYKLNDVEQKENLEIMKNLNSNSLALELGWMDKDGKQDVSKIAGDVRFLKSRQQIIASVYSQGKTAGTKNTVADIKNIDLSNNNSTSVAAAPFDIGAYGFSHLNPK